MDYRNERCRPVRRITILGFATLTALFALLIPAVASAAPTATITGGPAEGSSTNANEVTFTISAINDPAKEIDFGCSLDNGPFAPCHAVLFPSCIPAGPGQETCTQSKTYTLPAPGDHVFKVVASECSASCNEDWGIWTDGPVAARSFNVDRQAPVVSVSSGPSTSTPLIRGTASFGLTVNETAQMSCVIDAEPAVACSSPFVIPGLANGFYDLRVSATDRAGNVSAPITHSFEVDIFKPKKCRKGKSAKAKAKRKKCLKKNAKAKVKWKKKHGLR